MGIRERLAVVVKSFKSVRSLAEKVGCSEGTIRTWVNGKSYPDLKTAIDICDLTGYRVEWLCTGNGPERLDSSEAVTEKTSKSAIDSELLYKCGEIANDVKLEMSLNVTPKNYMQMVHFIYILSYGKNEVDWDDIKGALKIFVSYGEAKTQ